MSLDAVFLSAHPDDAVFSAAAEILRLVGLGQKVAVWTVFSASAQAAIRQAEDQAACAVLGVQSQSLGFSDAPLRQPFYQGYTSICLQQHPSDHVFGLELQHALQSLLRQHSQATVYFPLAVGGHIDHRLLHACQSLIACTHALHFYEDRPYCWVASAVALRMRALDVDAGLSMDYRAWIASQKRLHYLRSYRPQGRARLQSLLAERRGFTAPVQPTEAWATARCVSADAATQAQIWLAICQYASQWPTVFGDHAQFVAESARYAQSLGAASGYAERIWTMQPVVSHDH